MGVDEWITVLENDFLALDVVRCVKLKSLLVRFFVQ